MPSFPRLRLRIRLPRRSGAVLVAMLLLVGLGACSSLMDPCLADGEGCAGRDTLVLATCPGDLSFVSLDGLFQGDKPTEGTTITVVGPLRQGGGVCTLLGCATNGCCNSCGGSMYLAEASTIDYDDTTAIRLSGSVEDVELACGGDESLICCPLPAEGETIAVTGTLVNDGNSLAGPHFALEVSELCAME